VENQGFSADFAFERKGTKETKVFLRGVFRRVGRAVRRVFDGCQTPGRTGLSVWGSVGRGFWTGWLIVFNVFCGVGGLVTSSPTVLRVKEPLIAQILADYFPRFHAEIVG
jgi:hypothetical protein